jgi:hypothetical protein
MADYFDPDGTRGFESLTPSRQQRSGELLWASQHRSTNVTVWANQDGATARFAEYLGKLTAFDSDLVLFAQLPRFCS